MNDIRRPDREADEIARIRAIVGRHTFPDFVTGFDVRLGEFHEEPSMWIAFRTVGERPEDFHERRARVDSLLALTRAVHRDLMVEYEDRYPYYRYERADGVQPETS